MRHPETRDAQEGGGALLEGVSFAQPSDRERELVATYSRTLLGRGQPTRPARRKTASGSVHMNLLVPTVLFDLYCTFFSVGYADFTFCIKFMAYEALFLYTIVCREKDR